MGRKEKERYINLGNLPKKQSGNIDWKLSVGYTVDGVYDNINFYIKIINYNTRYLIISYLDIEYKIHTSNFLTCQLRKIIKNNNPRTEDIKNKKSITSRQYKKDTTDTIFEYLKTLNYTLLSEYINSKHKILFKGNDGYFYYMLLSDLKRGIIPAKFYKSNPYTVQNIKLWCKLNNKPFELISDIYKSAEDKLQWKCLKEECGDIFESCWRDIESGRGCGICHGSQVGLSNCLATKNPELAKEWHPTKNGDLTSWDVTYGSRQKVWWKCKECNHEWPAVISSRNNNNNGTGCPECNKSKGEKECKRVSMSKSFIEILQEDYEKLLDVDKNNNIYLISQKEFNGLIGLGSKLLSYDFYLPNYNLLIEYQGLQHEKYCKGFHKSKKDFKRQLEHDERKRQYCIDNNIKLLEIWYYDFDKIEEILEKELKF